MELIVLVFSLSLRVLIGYCGLFDFGLGRALTNLVGRALGAGEENTIPSLAFTASVLMLAMGTLGGLGLALASPVLVQHVLNVPPPLQADALRSLLIVSLSIPIVIVTTGFRGIVEAYQRFDLSNILRIPQGIFSFAGPLVAVEFSHSLFPIVLILLAGRIALLLAYALIAYKIVPGWHSGKLFQTAPIPELLSFGGWMTVSGIVSPVMASLDRLLIGTMLTLQSVAYYSTPNEVATKLLLVPAALAGVMFPTFSTLLISEPLEAHRLYARALKYLAAVLALPTLAILMFSHYGLKIWLGMDFANHSSVPLQILVVGVFLNGLAALPFALIQGLGNAEWTGKLHLLELPLYLIIFYPLVRRFGIDGAAFAWSLRAVFDATVLFVLAARVQSKTVGSSRCEILSATNPALQE